MTEQENREAFENYIMGLDIFKRRSPKFLFMLDDDGAYDNQDILALYDAWNASTQRQGFKLVPVSYECKWCGCTEISGFKEDI